MINTTWSFGLDWYSCIVNKTLKLELFPVLIFFKCQIEKPFFLHLQWKIKPKLKVGSNLFCIVETKRCFSKWKTNQHWSLKNCFTSKFNIGKKVNSFCFLKKSIYFWIKLLSFNCMVERSGPNKKLVNYETLSISIHVLFHVNFLSTRMLLVC